MKKYKTILQLFCIMWLPCKAQNQPSLHKENLEELRAVFVQNVQLKSGSLSKYKNINFNIDACSIEITTIDYENSNNENCTVVLPITGAILKNNGELVYKNTVIKEVIENRITKQITTHFYNNSKDVGLFLKLENKEKKAKFKEHVQNCSNIGKLERN